MAVKKTKKDETISKTGNTKMGRVSYKELSEELKLKLKQSEEKIAELNQKYKKVVDIQKKKIEDKYKKIIEDLESKKYTPAKSSVSNNAEINKLQKRLEKLEKSNQKLEEEKRKIELKNEELKQKAKETLKLKSETTSKTDKEALKEIKALKQQLLESEQEKKNLKEKLKEAVADLKNAKKNTNKLSKEDKEQYKENLRILKQIEKESKALDKKRELIKKEEEKLREIRGDIKTSAKDIASTMKKSHVSDDYKDDEPSYKENGNLLSNIDSSTEEGITKLATLLCAAMDDYREQKEKEREELEKSNIEIEQLEPEVRPIISEGEDRLNKASEQLENLVENRLEDSDSTKDENLGKRPFTIIDKIENSRVEINEGYTPPAGGQTIVAAHQDTQTAPVQQPNITVKVEAPKESAKLAKPETQLRPASETPTMRMKLLDDIDDYEKKLVITYGFDNMPENTYYSKYKKILRNAARISLFGNLQEGLEMFKLIRDQNIPDEYKQMIDKNIQDITYYLRGLHRVRME